MHDKPEATILNVDGNLERGEAVSSILREACFEVVQASDCAEALHHAGQKPDLILLNGDLPGLPECELCRELQTGSATATIPILRLDPAVPDTLPGWPAGETSAGDPAAMGLTDGFVGYLTAPVDPAALLTVVKTLLRARRAEMALRASEEKFRTFVENAGDIIYSLSLEGTFAYVSPNCRELLGFEVAEVIGRPYSWLIHPEDLPVCNAFFQDVVTSGERRGGIEYRVRRKNSAWQWHATTASALKDHDGRVISFLGISRDVSERRQSEEALRGNERKLANAMKIARLGYWEYDVASDLFTFDDHFYALFRTSAEKVGGYTMSPERYATLFVHPEDAYMVETEMQKAFTTTDPNFSSQLEHRILFADGETGHIAVRYNIVKDEQGRTIKTYGANQDITERKQAEIALRESEEQLRQAQKLESVGRLAGGVAHDFNNMLAAILGNAEILQTRLVANHAGNEPGHETNGNNAASDETGGEYSDPWDSLEQIVHAAHLAGDLTHQLLAFGRRQGAEPDLLDPGELVADAMKMLRRLVSENIQIRTLVRPGLRRVWADPTQLSQVLMNLVVNACDAMPGGGELSIDVANEDLDTHDVASRVNVTAGPFVCIRVRDSGSGMDEETRHRMFDPFFTTKPVGKGSGLGLSVVYGIVEQAKGHLTVDSRSGHGTTVAVWLPAARVDAVAREKQKTVPEPLRGTETILVCEDEDMVREPLCSVLRSRGFTVIEARDGKQALVLAANHDGPIHLLLTDVIMPGMSGPELARMLEERSGISRVIFTSGYASEDIFAGVALGDEARFVEKPCTPSELLQHVQELLHAS